MATTIPARPVRVPRLTVHDLRRLRASASLVVPPRGIDFRTLPSGLVRVEIAVENAGSEHTGREWLRLESAPLGAFVRPHRSFRLAVPPLAPGQRTVVSRELRPSPPRALEQSDGLPPGVVWTRAGSGEGDLPLDPLALLRRGSIHWAGNFNVFIGKHASERHLARAVRILPGCTNLAMFVVGTNPDDYRLATFGPEWKTQITVGGCVRFNRSPATVIQEWTWVHIARPSIVILEMCPPVDAIRGRLDVHVRQRSTGREAVVEFDLDPAAAGPGCYVA